MTAQGLLKHLLCAQSGVAQPPGGKTSKQALFTDAHMQSTGNDHPDCRMMSTLGGGEQGDVVRKGTHLFHLHSSRKEDPPP